MLKMLFPFIPDEVPDELRGLIKSIPEEIANMLSHGFGIVLFLIGVPILVIKSLESANNWAFWSCLIFGISLFMVYFSSTLYHSVYQLEKKKRRRVFDHISIYFLIAGSFTPFILIFQQNQTGWLVFWVLWTMVLIGSIFKYFFTHKFNLVSTFAYVGMGLLSGFVIGPLSKVIPAISLQFLIIGGISYLVGVVFYLWKSLYFSHPIWHIFVLIGSFSHFLAVFLSISS